MTFWDRHTAFDFETDGTEPEYALQPWRVAQGLAWPTSLVWLTYRERAADVRGGLRPDRPMMKFMLETAIREKRRLVGWNVVFDLAWLLAYDLEDLVFECKWLDAMLIWKHATIEPQYDDRFEGKSYSLKAFVPEHFPAHAGYEADVTYHNPTPEELARLHSYNIKDCVFTLRGAKMYWEMLTPQQQKVALIEAECFPMVAKANLHGMLVDTLVLHDLQGQLETEADDALTLLQPFGLTEKIVRSPTQLRHLMFNVWGMTPHHTTDKGEFSTDKETLHELAAAGDMRAKTLRKYREALNNKTKFADNALKAAVYNGDGYARPECNVFRTYTGRMTYSSFQERRAKRETKAEKALRLATENDV